MIIYINLNNVCLTWNRSRNRNPVFRKNVGTGTVFKFPFPQPCAPPPPPGWGGGNISCHKDIFRQPSRSFFTKNYLQIVAQNWEGLRGKITKKYSSTCVSIFRRGRYAYLCIRVRTRKTSGRWHFCKWILKLKLAVSGHPRGISWASLPPSFPQG